jgi:hypothetical protein
MVSQKFPKWFEAFFVVNGGHFLFKVNIFSTTPLKAVT